MVSSEERPYSCDHCSKSFRLSQHLKEHIRTHTGEKPYKCTICGHAFCQISNLKSHKKTHTKIKGFRCEECGKEFRRSFTLKQHKLTHTRVKRKEKSSRFSSPLSPGVKNSKTPLHEKNAQLRLYQLQRDQAKPIKKKLTTTPSYAQKTKHSMSPYHSYLPEQTINNQDKTFHHNSSPFSSSRCSSMFTHDSANIKVSKSFSTLPAIFVSNNISGFSGHARSLPNIQTSWQETSRSNQCLSSLKGPYPVTMQHACSEKVQQAKLSAYQNHMIQPSQINSNFANPFSTFLGFPWYGIHPKKLNLLAHSADEFSLINDHYFNTDSQFRNQNFLRSHQKDQNLERIFNKTSNSLHVSSGFEPVRADAGSFTSAPDYFKKNHSLCNQKLQNAMKSFELLKGLHEQELNTYSCKNWETTSKTPFAKRNAHRVASLKETDLFTHYERNDVSQHGEIIIRQHKLKECPGVLPKSLPVESHSIKQSAVHKKSFVSCEPAKNNCATNAETRAFFHPTKTTCLQAEMSINSKSEKGTDHHHPSQLTGKEFFKEFVTCNNGVASPPLPHSPVDRKKISIAKENLKVSENANMLEQSNVGKLGIVYANAPADKYYEMLNVKNDNGMSYMPVIVWKPVATGWLRTDENNRALVAR